MKAFELLFELQANMTGLIKYVLYAEDLII